MSCISRQVLNEVLSLDPILGIRRAGEVLAESATLFGEFVDISKQRFAIRWATDEERQRLEGVEVEEVVLPYGAAVLRDFLRKSEDEGQCYVLYPNVFALKVSGEMLIVDYNRHQLAVGNGESR